MLEKDLLNKGLFRKRNTYIGGEVMINFCSSADDFVLNTRTKLNEKLFWDNFT